MSSYTSGVLRYVFPFKPDRAVVYPPISTSERKFSNRWYSYSYRRFHTSILRYSFESVEVGTTVLGPVGAAGFLWRSYSPRKVNNDIDPLRPLDHLAVWGTDLNAWVGREAPLIPEHLRPRFNAFLQAFLSSFEILEYKPGSLRLVARVSPLGNEDVTMILLLRQAEPLPTMQGSKDQLVEMVKKFTVRDPTARSRYQIVGSFAFIG